MTPEEAKALREHLKLNLYDFVKVYMNEPFPKVDDYGDQVNYQDTKKKNRAGWAIFGDMDDQPIDYAKTYRREYFNDFGFQPGGEPLEDKYAGNPFDFKKKTYKDENGKEIKIDIDLDTFRKIPGFPTMPSRRYAALMRAFPITEATIIL